MAREKSFGIIIFPEDMARIKRCVKPEYQFAVVWALSQYATDGILPTEEELGEGGMVAFEFIVEKVRDALETYRANSEKRKAAANARWNADECKPMQMDANAYGCIRTDAEAPKTGTETETETVNRNGKVAVERNVSSQSAAAPAENVIAFDGSDLAEDIRRNNTADDMIADYNLPHDRVTRSALLEDLERHGEARMREVLTTACQSNSREKVTVNFWRAIIAGKGRDSPNGAGYGEVLRQRKYDAAYFASLETDLEGA